MKSTSDAFSSSESYVNNDGNIENELLMTKNCDKSNKITSQATCHEKGLTTPVAQNAVTTKSKGRSSLSNKEPIWQDPELVDKSPSGHS